jgi:hypothetical protein
MKLEHLSDGSPECPLIRLHAFVPAEVRQLLAALQELASGAARQVELHGLPFIEAVAGCQLTLRVADWDQGMLRDAESAFHCALTRGGWEDVAGLLEPFAEGVDGYQWLSPAGSEVGWLISVCGEW